MLFELSESQRPRTQISEGNMGLFSVHDLKTSRNQSRNRKTNSRSTSTCNDYHAYSRFWKNRQNLGVGAYSQNSFQDGCVDQKTDVFNPFSEESGRTIHNFGKIELFELSWNAFHAPASRLPQKQHLDTSRPCEPCATEC